MKKEIRKTLGKIKRKIWKRTRKHKLLYPIRSLLSGDLKEWVEKKNIQEFVDVDELRPQYEKACLYLKKKLGNNNLGDYLEFGVSQGTSLSCMHSVVKDLDLKEIRLFGFDSFEGLPEEYKDDDDGVWKAGQFRRDIESTTSYLTNKGVDWGRTYLIKGWFSNTCTNELIEKHNIKKASLIMIDCDMYSSSKDALNFCTHLIKDEAIIFFDDWNTASLAEKNLGEKKAFDEFLQENPQFEAVEFGSYNYKLKENGKIFKVINRKNLN